ncbi:MAG: DinB family protein [Pirellulales bacterium]|nr:DinB family protein [Pirellulales bacterium]
MRIGQSMIPEFEAEMANTRKVLERIPDDKLDWKIHEKSNTIGWVANHLADIPGWVDMTINKASLDVAPVDGEPYQTPSESTTAAILALFDDNVAKAKPILEGVEDATLMQPWSLLQGGQELMTLPKLVVVRTWVFNHSIHHRAHLCVYLRVNDLPVPGLYGPSGDEATT